jgi:hypothetical protein
MKPDYGIVYFIGPKDTGPVKIGTTSTRDAEKRLRQLQTGSAENYVVLGQVEGGPLVEQAIHSLLAPHLVRGEWFERNAALAVLSHLNSEMKGWSDNQFAMALADTGSYLEQSAGETSPQQSLAIRVASDLVRDRFRDMINVPIGQPLPLRAWLQRQKERDDPAGDLANDILGDQDFPLLGTMEDYLRYITDKTSNPSITRALFDAWIECALDIKGLSFKVDSAEQR